MTGKFISLEGVEGCGKSVQSKLLVQHLSECGLPAILTREPGGTVIGEKIREILLDPVHTSMSSTTELLLYIASRVQHLHEVILPALDAGTLVICDRYTDATRAYQGYGRGLGLELIERLVQEAGIREPDITLLLDIPVEIGLSRARRYTSDRLESEDIAFHTRVRDGYLALHQRYPQRIKCIDAMGTIPEVHERICHYIIKELDV